LGNILNIHSACAAHGNRQLVQKRAKIVRQSDDVAPLSASCALRTAGRHQQILYKSAAKLAAQDSTIG
jgi:hypothetical protein